MAHAAVSLRDQFRAETRARIAEAALTIAERDGFDAARPDVIAAAAGISRRTLFNYVHGASGALAIPVEDLLAAIHAEFVARPPHETPVVAISRALAAVAPEQLAQALRLQRIGVQRADALLDELRVKVWLGAELQLLAALRLRLGDAVVDDELEATVACLLTIGRVVVRQLTRGAATEVTPERLARNYEQACHMVFQQLGEGGDSRSDRRLGERAATPAAAD